jgi:hypothetical protein
LLLHLACVWFIIKRQQSVNVESEHEPWLFRVIFRMCSTRRHISGCTPLWSEVRASIVPALLYSNLISTFICRVAPQRLDCSPWIRNFFRFDATVGSRRADYQLNFFIVQTWPRVLFTNLQLPLGESAIPCLEIEGLLFSSFDIAFEMSEGGLRVSEK